MKNFLIQLKWQFILLQKNNIIAISFAVTFIYGLILYFLRGVGDLDRVLVSLILNDPSVIGYFFIGLAIYTEMKFQILSAVFVTPVSIHLFLITKVLALTVIGVICSVGLTLSVRGLHVDLFSLVAGSSGICLLSALLGLIMLTFASEFLKFTMISIPVFLVFVNIPLLQYLGVMDIGLLKYLFPVQGSVDLIDHAVSDTKINSVYSYLSVMVMVPVFYGAAYFRFNKKIVHQ